VNRRLQNGEDIALLDIRTREEHEAVNIPGSKMLTQIMVQQIMGQWPRERAIVVYDHTGERSLDATAFFVGHGFLNARALAGGIDQWSREIDSSLPRYHLE
jgi:rhodanese-related sulfurtransferase